MRGVKSAEDYDDAIPTPTRGKLKDAHTQRRCEKNGLMDSRDALKESKRTRAQ